MCWRPSKFGTRTTLLSNLENDHGVLAARGDGGEEPDWHSLEARLQAFASESVFTAVQDSSTAAGAFHRVASGRGVFESATLPPSATALVTARKVADDADDEVIERIRAELQGKGRPLRDWQPNPQPSDP
jgi:hypothetical protein